MEGGNKYTCRVCQLEQCDNEKFQKNRKDSGKAAHPHDKTERNIRGPSLSVSPPRIHTKETARIVLVLIFHGLSKRIRLGGPGMRRRVRDRVLRERRHIKVARPAELAKRHVVVCRERRNQVGL